MTEGRANIRDDLLEATFWFVQSVAQLAGVRRIALVGSILRDRRSPKDVDLLVYVADDADLADLAAAARRLQGRLQSQNRGADVFLADEHGRYLGRTCPWKVCQPGIRASCDAIHCGRRSHLHDDLGTIRLPDSLIAAPPLDLWPVVVRRCRPPADVERLVNRLHEPHSNQVEHAAASHAPAGPAHGDAIHQSQNTAEPKYRLRDDLEGRPPFRDLRC
jgi:predicted nucleotidyltransferase